MLFSPFGLYAALRSLLYITVIIRQNRVSFFLHHLTTKWRTVKLEDEVAGKTTVQKILTILRNIRDLPGVRGAQMIQIDWIIDTGKFMSKWPSSRTTRPAPFWKCKMGRRAGNKVARRCDATRACQCIFS